MSFQGSLQGRSVDMGKIMQSVNRLTSIAQLLHLDDDLRSDLDMVHTSIEKLLNEAEARQKKHEGACEVDGVLPLRRLGKDELKRCRTEDVTEYYYFKGRFSDEQIKQILEVGAEYPSQDGPLRNSTDLDKSYRTSQIQWLPMEDGRLKWLYNELSMLAQVANMRIWRFDIAGFGEDLQLTTYTANSNAHYDWHVDVGMETPFRKLSVTVQLSDPASYQGGRLEFCRGRSPREAPNGKGDVVVFPSLLLHRVTPITAGVRRSLVIWISGAPLV